MGAIRGQRLSAGTKLSLVRAVMEAKRAGAAVAQACRVLRLSRTRLYRWVRGKRMDEVRVTALEDRPSIAQVVRHRISPEEREAILEIAQEEDLDQYSRKIVGWGFSPQATRIEVRRVWDQALCAEGLLEGEGKRMPQAVSDQGPQMKAKSIKAFFRDLGIGQLCCRPHTPDDNAEMESFFATLKCERLYRGSYDDPLLAEADIAEFITYYNNGHLHQGIGFVTPQERHEGKDGELREKRRRGLQVARLVRLIENSSPAPG